jgi:hypothetical protein
VAETKMTTMATTTTTKMTTASGVEDQCDQHSDLVGRIDGIGLLVERTMMCE